MNIKMPQFRFKWNVKRCNFRFIIMSGVLLFLTKNSAAAAAKALRKSTTKTNFYARLLFFLRKQLLNLKIHEAVFAPALTMMDMSMWWY